MKPNKKSSCNNAAKSKVFRSNLKHRGLLNKSRIYKQELEKINRRLRSIILKRGGYGIVKMRDPMAQLYQIYVRTFRVLIRDLHSRGEG